MLGDRDIERVIAKAVQSLNKHLPSQRKILSELLSEDRPAVLGRDNSVQRIKKEELEKIARMIPEEDYGRLKIPIYIEIAPDYGRGMAKVYGRLECEVTKKILRKEEDEKEEEEEKNEIFICREDVRKLRRELKTATQYAFFYGGR